ncbi:MAG: hypothetical protein GC149_13355 [Gammaproteobacteria bacterium]|nr:hypothetical protein [Gammaproteobacteria bacterium]
MFFNRLSTNQSLILLIGTSLVIKLIMAHVTPITGDEAYFILWGKHPDYGFYDHPPMVGWWLTALMKVSEAPVWLRMPTIVGTTLIGWVIYKLVLPRGQTNALIAGGLYWLAPVNLIAPWITTDTPLIILSFFSAVCFYKAQRHDHLGWYLLSGILLGAAFFSKFFAGLLGIAYLLYLILFVRRGIRPYLGIVVLLVGVAPWIAANLAWNYYHCWDNYLFNLENRTSDFSVTPLKPLTYALMLLYLITPPILFYLFRRPGEMWTVMRDGGLGMFLALFLIPLALFVPLSFGKDIGLHWLLSFYPFLFIAVALLLHYGQLRVSFYFMWGFSVLHLLVLGIILFLAPGIFKHQHKIYQELVFGMYAKELVKDVQPYIYDFPLATPSYAQSAILDYHSGKHVLVFGPGSYHARQDDMLTDYADYNHKAIAILSYKKNVDQYARYFKAFSHIIIPFKGTQFHLGVGIDFNYALYKKEVIDPIKQKYYKIPAWLPRGECYMDAR